MSNNEWRNEKGQYIDGHPGGPGRPSRAIEKEFLIELKLQAHEAWPKIIAKVVTEALRGKPWAIKFLASYGMGLPQSKIDVTTGGETINGPQTFDEKVAAIVATLNDATAQETEGSVGCDLVATTGETTT